MVAVVTAMHRIVAWWFAPLPRARIAWLRTILYLFIFVDVFITTAWVGRHGQIPGDLYDPLQIGRLLPLPTPRPGTVAVVQFSLLLFAAIAATGRLPRVAGTAVALLYAQWMFFAFSYGKVDHDRVAFLVALAVLPAAGPARWSDRDADDGAGWAIRAIQVAVVLTYFLAAFAKLRFGGVDWATGATLMRAVIRRGTSLGDPLESVPLLLTATQWFIIAFELASPLLLTSGRIGRAMLAVCLAFHAVTFATIAIIFLPHVVCLLSFVPLEGLSATRRGFWTTSGAPRPLGRRPWGARRTTRASADEPAPAGRRTPIGRPGAGA